MEILKILEESGKDLYIEDLDFFETELATGEGYDEAYKVKCLSRINKLRAWLTDSANNEKDTHTSDNGSDSSDGPFISLGDLVPKAANPTAVSITPVQMIFDDISVMRGSSSYKTHFKKYVAGKAEIDAAFVDKHYAFFQPWELDAIISVKQMGEDFIEKYFGALDHDKIARYQEFSEAFFMKHFAQMDHTIVLEHGKNEWRKKENRSKQLDVFLRLKGVKI